MPDSPIATRTLIAVSPSADERVVTLGVGAPIAVGPDEWTCRLTLDGLHPPKDIYAADSWQALMLAQNLARQLLGYFVDDGGRLKDPDNGELVELGRLFTNGI